MYWASGHCRRSESRVKEEGRGQFGAKTTKRSISSWSSVFSVHSSLHSIDLIVIKQSISLKTTIDSSVQKTLKGQLFFLSVSPILFKNIASGSNPRERKNSLKSSLNKYINLILINGRSVGLRSLLLTASGSMFAPFVREAYHERYCEVPSLMYRDLNRENQATWFQWITIVSGPSPAMQSNSNREFWVNVSGVSLDCWVLLFSYLSKRKV